MFNTGVQVDCVKGSVATLLLRKKTEFTLKKTQKIIKKQTYKMLKEVKPILKCTLAVFAHNI